jgi:ADP-heptose:LPS heptosyltransferase
LVELVPPAHVHTLRTGGLAPFVADAVRTITRLRGLRFDVVVDLEFFSRAAAALAWLVGARVSIGYDRHLMEGLYKGCLYSHPVPYNPHLHVAAGYVSLIDVLGAPANGFPLGRVPVRSPESLPLPRFLPTVDEQRRLLARLRAEGARLDASSRLAVFNCNSSDLIPMRRWPRQGFVELARGLLETPGVHVVLTGVAAERDEASGIHAAIGSDRVTNLAGRTSIRELLTLFTLSSLMVTNDSGPAHFSSLTDLPTIALFGPETPEIFGVLGENKVSLSSGLACSPCVSAFNHRRTACSDNVCLQAISVELVLRTARELLDRTSARRPLCDLP